ncbi:MAG: hypothetical protein HQK67_06690 [Desulfamplus sp.]|nr:hypothetical protein [Desulfamplus sp.]
MGGRLDATNVLSPNVTVISNLSIEHTEYLGDTLEQIAAEKGGIIKSHTPLVTGVTQASAIAVLNDIARQKEAPVYQYGKEFLAIGNPEYTISKSEISTLQTNESELHESELHESEPNKSKFQRLETDFTYRGIDVTWNNMKIRLPGHHQIQNATLALATCELLMKQNIGNVSPTGNSNLIGKSELTENSDLSENSELTENRRLTEESIRKGLLATTWPGRLEYIMHKPLVLIDGAHNLDAAENLGKYLIQNHGQKIYEHGSVGQKEKYFNQGLMFNQRLTMIIGILDDKPYKEMLTYLLPAADRIIFTKARIDRSLDPQILRDFAVTVTPAQVIIIENVAEAVEYAINGALEQIHKASEQSHGISEQIHVASTYTHETSEQNHELSEQSHGASEQNHNISEQEQECICIAGSLYVAGEAREKILKDFLRQS